MAVLSNICIKFELYYVEHISKRIIIVKKVQKTAQMASVGDQESIYLSHLRVCVKVTAARMKTKHSVYCVLTINTSEWSAVMKEWVCGVGRQAAGNGQDNLFNWCHYCSTEMLSVKQSRGLLLGASLQCCYWFQ